jgi:acyl-CoA dehydrogenase family protein 9
MQLRGGAGYLRGERYEQIMRDIRVFAIFEGANDVMRSYIALSALKPLGDELELLTEFDLTDPVRVIGTWASYVGGRVKREVRPHSVTMAHEALSELAEPVADQVKRLRSVGESVLRRHGKDIVQQGMLHKRLASALSDVYAQIAVLSRVTSIFEDQGVDASGQERFIAETFCTRAARRVQTALNRIDDNDDERMHSIARLAYKRGAYGYALFED